MELVLKQPEGKQPFIGILFESSYKAGTENQDLLEKISTKPPDFSIELEPHANNLTLRLLCRNPIIGIRFYRGIKYNPEKLEKWLRETRFKKPFNFGHVLKEGDKHVVVRALTEKKLFVFSIKEITLRSNEYSP